MKKELLAKEVLKIRQEVTIVEDFIKNKKEEFEKTIFNEKNALLDLVNKRDNLESELIKLMKEEHIGSIKTDEANISSSTRKSLKLEDENKLQTYILENAVKLKDYVKDSISTKDELIDKVMPRKVTSTSVKFLSDRYFDITGETLPGIITNETNYLTIKKTNE